MLRRALCAPSLFRLSSLSLSSFSPSQFSSTHFSPRHTFRWTSSNSTGTQPTERPWEHHLSVLGPEVFSRSTKTQEKKGNEASLSLREMIKFYDQERVSVPAVVSLFEQKGFSVMEWGNGKHMSLTTGNRKSLNLEIYFSTESPEAESGVGISGETEEGNLDEPEKLTIGNDEKGLDEEDDQMRELSEGNQLPKSFQWHPLLFRLVRNSSKNYLIGKAFIDGDTGSILLESIAMEPLPISSLPPLSPDNELPTTWIDVHKMSPVPRSDLYDFLGASGLSDITGRGIGLLVLGKHQEQVRNRLEDLALFLKSP